jgi:hypothetical protein
MYKAKQQGPELMKEIIELVAKHYPALAMILEEAESDQAVDELCQLVGRAMLVGKTRDPKWAESEDGAAFDRFIADKLQDPSYAAVYKQTLEELAAKAAGQCGCCAPDNGG